MPKPNKNGTQLRGIVVTGNSRQEVEENYRSVVTGVSVKALQSPDSSFTILSSADADISLFNPSNGAMDLVEASDDLIGRMEFLASDSNENVTAFYSLCSDGCGSHLIADDPKLLKHCPVCASELKELSEDEINEMTSSNSNDDDDDCAECSEDSIISVASSYEEAKQAYEGLVTGDVKKYAIACDENTVVSNLDTDCFAYSPFSSKASATAEENVEIDMEAVANSSEDEANAHYYVCASDKCGKHIVSSSENPIFCPVCSSGVIEPEDDPEAIAKDKQTDEIDDDYESDSSTFDGNKIVAVGASAKEARDAFVSMAKNEIEDVYGYDCEGTVVASNVDNSEFSFSPFDGESVSETELEEDAEFEITASSNSDEEVDAYHLVCSADDECGMHVISSSDDTEFCPVCSSSLVEPDEEDSLTSLSGDDDDEEDDEEDYDEDEDEDDDMDDDEDDDEEDDDDDDEENSLSVSSVRFRDEVTSSSKPAPKPKPNSKESTSSKIHEGSEEKSIVAASMLSIASNYSEYELDKFEVACAGTIQNETTWIAFYDGMPVAKATASSAMKHSEIFNKPLFGNAVTAMARENSIPDALSSFGFQEFRPEFNAESHVEQEIATQVEAKVKDVEEKYQSEAKDYNDRMLSALATVAQGIDRKFFKGMTNPNPIKTALSSSLAAAGVRNPETLISKAFADHSDAYHKNLISKASEIVAKSVEVQNELAEAVSGSNPETNTDPVVPIGTPVATAPVTTQKPTESVSSGDDKNVISNMDRILAGLGRRR